MRKPITEYIFATLTQKDLKMPFCIMTVGLEKQMNVYRPKGIEHHQFLFTLDGVGEVVVFGKKVRAEAGTLLYHAPNTPHFYYPVTEEWKVCWITFRQAFSLFSAKNGVYPLGNAEGFVQILDEMLALEKSVLYGEHASVLLYKLLLKTNRVVENYRYDESSYKMRSAMDYINQMYCQDIELDTLSSMCGLSGEYFCRLFKKTYGVTAFAYIRTLRIQEAKKRLLLYKEHSLSQIAESVGYHSVNYFLTDFKRSEKKTPTEFRKNHQSSSPEVLEEMK